MHVVGKGTFKVAFRLTPRDFSYGDVKTNGWKVDIESYEICFGASSRDIRKRILVQLPKNLINLVTRNERTGYLMLIPGQNA
jgi:hypothetical protein